MEKIEVNIEISIEQLAEKVVRDLHVKYVIVYAGVAIDFIRGSEPFKGYTLEEYEKMLIESYEKKTGMTGISLMRNSDSGYSEFIVNVVTNILKDNLI